jgi:hypothetical protein
LDDGIFWVRFADSDQAQGTGRARDQQVEQNEVDGRRRRQDRSRFVDRGGLKDLGILCGPADGAPQRFAKQRVILHNQKSRHGRPIMSFRGGFNRGKLKQARERLAIKRSPLRHRVRCEISPPERPR